MGNDNFPPTVHLEITASLDWVKNFSLQKSSRYLALVFAAIFVFPYANADVIVEFSNGTRTDVNFNIEDGST